MERAENVRKRCLLRRFFSKYHVLLISTVTLVFVYGPQHLYGLVVDCEGLQNISPPVFFVAIQMIMQPCLEVGEEGIGKQYTRRIFTAGSVALSLGIILAGVSGMAFQEKNFLFSLLYGALAGTGAFLMTTLLRKVLERVFGSRDSHLIEVLQSTSLALSQLILPLLLAHFRVVYGGEMTILLMGSLLLHTLPLGLLLSHSQRHLLTHNLVRYQSVAISDLKTPQNGMRRWGHMTGINNREEEEADEPPMKKVTNQGVEILDTIPEEDEASGKSSIEITEIKLENPQRNLSRKYEFFFEYWRESRRILTELFVNPFRSVFRRQTLLPGVILKACGVFIYILMVSGLPSFAAGAAFRLSFVHSSILLVLMALPVLLVTLVSVWMEDLLREKAKHWHISGEICKLLGCIVTTFSRTIFFLRMGVLLLGIGQGVSTILQDRVLKENVQEDWSHTKGHISAVSGYLVLIIGFFTNRLLENLHIGTIFLTASLFYSAAIFVYSLSRLSNYF